MKLSDMEFLLADRRVVDEIRKHLWIESQKAGCNIGEEKAQEDWLIAHAESWMKYHLPDKYELLKAKVRKRRQK